MEKQNQPQLEHDDTGSAVLRERELHDALSYLDRAISNLATEEPASRWMNSYKAPDRRAFTTRPLAFIVERCVSAFRPGHPHQARSNALPFH